MKGMWVNANITIGSGSIGLSSKMSKQDVQAFMDRMFKEIDGMVTIMKKVPRDMLLVLRNKFVFSIFL